MDLLSSYGLFLAKAVTVVVAFAAIVLIVLNAAMRKRHSGGQLRLTHLDDDYREMKEDLQLAKMKPQAQKVWLKQHKRREAKSQNREAQCQSRCERSHQTNTVCAGV